MKNKSLFLFLIAIAIVFFSFASIVTSTKILENTKTNEFNFNGNYKKAWKKVDSLEQKGLTRSALEIVEDIYKTAKKENNHPQFIKSIFYKLKFANYTEENSHVKIINDVNDEIKNASFPSNAILKSILANIYWQYYQNNRWRFQQRTETLNFDNNDFETWDLKRIIKEIVKNYQASLENSNGLKNIFIKDFEDILYYSDREESHLRPTLYDLLTNNALDFYINDEASVTDPVYKFELNNENDFSEAKDFIKINYSTKDSLSLKYYAILLYQKLIEFHLNDDVKDALIDVDLARLSFVKRNSINTEKESYYLTALTNLKNKHTNVPYSSLISYNIAKYYFDKGIEYNPSVSDDNKWELKKALEICNESIKNYPDTYGAEKCLWLKSQILQKSLTFQTENANLADKPFRALISYKNVSEIFIKVIKWSESLDKNEKIFDQQKLIALYNSQKPKEEWSINLPNDEDYQNHSVEIKMPSLPFGKYLIIMGTDKNFTYEKNAVAYAKTWVTNISFVRRDINNSNIQFYALNRKTGYPLSNINADIFVQKYSADFREYKYEKLKSSKTNSDGGFEFKKTDNQFNLYKVVFTDGDDRFESENYYYNYYGNSEYRKYTVTQFYIDRAIYRPGQTVYFKGLMFETDSKKDHKVLANNKTIVTFFDANQQKISDLTLTTNEYGTFNGQFTIPLGKIGGQFYIMNGYGTQYFRVEEYKRPKFEAAFEPIKGSYSLNDEIITTGFAKTYSGANLNDVEVKYRVVRSTYFPYYNYRWRFYYDWFWGKNTEMEITNGVTKTDDEGKFKFEFNAIPDLSIKKETNPVFNFSIYADVIDVTGETHSTSTIVSAGYVALVASISLPDIIDNDSLDSYITTTNNLNGEFEPAKVFVDVYKLKSPDRVFRNRLWEKPDKFLLTKEEYYNSFDNDIYDDEDQFYKWDKEKKVFETSFITTDSSFIKFENQDDWQPGKYVATLRTKDKNGTPIELIKYFTLFNSKSNKIPLKEASWIYHNFKNYQPGEIAKLFIGSAEKNVKALYELEYDGKVISKEWITLNDEQKEIDIPIKEDYR